MSTLNIAVIAGLGMFGLGILAGVPFNEAISNGFKLGLFAALMTAAIRK